MARTPEELSQILSEQRRQQADRTAGYFLAWRDPAGLLTLIDDVPRFFDQRPQVGDAIYLPNRDNLVVTGFCHMFFLSRDEFAGPFEDSLPLVVVKLGD